MSSRVESPYLNQRKKNKSRPQPYVRPPPTIGMRPHLILFMVTFTLVHYHRPFVQASHVARRVHGIYATSVNKMDIGERTVPLISSAKEESTRPFNPKTVRQLSMFMISTIIIHTFLIAMIVLFMTVLKIACLTFFEKKRSQYVVT